MKKPRISFDKDAIVAFLINHCEKFMVGLVGLIGLGLVWNGVNALRVKSVRSEQTPQAISQLASQTVGHIDASTKPPAELTRREHDLVAAIDPWRPQQVKIAPPPELALLDRPIIEQLARRAKPEVLPVEDLRALAGVAVLPDPVDPAAMIPPAGLGPARERPVDGPAPPKDGPRGRQPRRPARGEEAPPEQPPMGEFGALAMPGERAKVVPYVVLTGLVPVEKQREEYRRAFGSAGFRDPQLDVPRWSQYLVERAVVGAAGAATKWERLKIKNVESFGQGGVSPAQPNQAPEPMQQEMLPPTFLLGTNDTDIGYVASLPQRLDEPWGFETVHPWFRGQLRKLLETSSGLSSDAPAVPIEPKRLKEAAKEFDGQLVELVGMQFFGEPQRGGEVVAFGVKSADGSVSFPVDGAPTGNQPVFVMSSAWARTLALDDGPKRDTNCTLRVRIEQLGQMPVAHVLGITYPGKDGEQAEELLDPAPFPLNGTGGMVGGEFGAGRFGDVAGGGGVSEGEEFRLFRFVDTTVKPGLRYRYRVRISLLNPNFGLPQQHLADPTSAKGEWILSKDSNETSPIVVPDATTLLVRTLSKDEIKQSKMKKDALQVLLLAPAKDTGNYSLRSLITDIGGLANVDDALNKPGDARTKGEKAITDRVLVDVRGRQEESSRPGFPSEPLDLLFLRPDGSFDFVSAADSQRLCNRYRATLDPPVDQGVPMTPEGLSPFETTPPPRRGLDK